MKFSKYHTNFDADVISVSLLQKCIRRYLHLQSWRYFIRIIFEYSVLGKRELLSYRNKSTVMGGMNVVEKTSSDRFK